MITNFFINLLFGHLVGDYLLQPVSLAVKKSTSNFLCALHCLIYTLSVCAFTKFNIIWFIVIFASHYLIDRFSVGDIWLRFIKGRDLEGFLKNGSEKVPFPRFRPDQRMNYIILRGSFAAVVYLVTDNTLHLMIAYYFGIWYFNIQ